MPIVSCAWVWSMLAWPSLLRPCALLPASSSVREAVESWHFRCSSGGRKAGEGELFGGWSIWYFGTCCFCRGAGLGWVSSCPSPGLTPHHLFRCETDRHHRWTIAGPTILQGPDDHGLWWGWTHLRSSHGPGCPFYDFPPVPLIPRFLDQVQEERLSATLVAPECTCVLWFPCLQWRVIGQRLRVWPLNGGLSQDVVCTIQSTRATYQSILHSQMAFQHWCVEKSLGPTVCALPHVLSFLQLFVDWDLPFSTVKTYTAAISSCHKGFGDRQCSVTLWWNASWETGHGPVSRSLAPQWDLAQLKFLSVQIALL